VIWAWVNPKPSIIVLPNINGSTPKFNNILKG